MARGVYVSEFSDRAEIGRFLWVNKTRMILRNEGVNQKLLGNLWSFWSNYVMESSIPSEKFCFPDSDLVGSF